MFLRDFSEWTVSDQASLLTDVPTGTSYQFMLNRKQWVFVGLLCTQTEHVTTAWQNENQKGFIVWKWKLLVCIGSVGLSSWLIATSMWIASIGLKDPFTC